MPDVKLRAGVGSNRFGTFGMTPDALGPHARALGAIMYGVSPVHTDEWFGARVREMVSSGWFQTMMLRASSRASSMTGRFSSTVRRRFSLSRSASYTCIRSVTSSPIASSPTVTPSASLSVLSYHSIWRSWPERVTMGLTFPRVAVPLMDR